MRFTGRVTTDTGAWDLLECDCGWKKEVAANSVNIPEYVCLKCRKSAKSHTTEEK